jgi:hypothetical protein
MPTFTAILKTSLLAVEIDCVGACCQRQTHVARFCCRSQKTHALSVLKIWMQQKIGKIMCAHGDCQGSQAWFPENGISGSRICNKRARRRAECNCFRL